MKNLIGLTLLVLVSCQHSPDGVRSLDDLQTTYTTKATKVDIDATGDVNVAWFVNDECIDVSGTTICFDANLDKGIFILKTPNDTLRIQTPWITNKLTFEPIVAYRAFSIDEKRIGVLHTFGFTLLYEGRICHTIGYPNELGFEFAVDEKGQLLIRPEDTKSWRVYECQ